MYINIVYTQNVFLLKSHEVIICRLTSYSFPLLLQGISSVSYSLLKMHLSLPPSYTYKTFSTDLSCFG